MKRGFSSTLAALRVCVYEEKKNREKNFPKLGRASWCAVIIYIYIRRVTILRACAFKEL